MAQEQTDKGGILGGLLDALMESKIKEREEKQKFKANMLSHGYSEADYKTFNTLRAHLSALVECGLNPNDYDMQKDPTEFYQVLAEKKAEAQSVIDKHAFAATIA